MTALPPIPNKASSGPETASSLPRTETELQRLQREANAMMLELQALEGKERELRVQNDILAREALSCGYDPGVLEPPAPKRRGKSLTVGLNKKEG